MQIKDSRIDKPYQMQCLPLYSILKAAGQTRIDFLSLDVEGAEYGILQTLFEQKNEIRVNVASIEVTYADLEGYSQSLVEMVYLMKRNGYVYDSNMGEDLVFVHKEFKEQF